MTPVTALPIPEMPISRERKFRMMGIVIAIAFSTAAETLESLPMAMSPTVLKTVSTRSTMRCQFSTKNMIAL